MICKFCGTLNTIAELVEYDFHLKVSYIPFPETLAEARTKGKKNNLKLDKFKRKMDKIKDIKMQKGLGLEP